MENGRVELCVAGRIPVSHESTTVGAGVQCGGRVKLGNNSILVVLAGSQLGLLVMNYQSRMFSGEEIRCLSAKITCQVALDASRQRTITGPIGVL